LKTIALILGWIGAPLWLLALVEIDTVLFVLTIFVTIAMILLSIKKLEAQHKIFSIIMLVFSVCTINIFNIAASILYLCVKKR